jgi:hypothetical protein
VAWLIGRSNARSDETLIRLSDPFEPPAEPDHSLHRPGIAACLIRTAVLVDRATAETLHRIAKVPPEKAGFYRRRTLDISHLQGRWDGFTRAEQDLLISPEGSWDWDEVWPRLVQIEDVRVLRWVLKVDPILAPFEFLSHDLAPAHQLVTSPEMLEGAGYMLPSDLRPAQQLAEQMVTRCIAEGILRGFLSEQDDEARFQFVRIAERMGSDQSGDLLVGSESVGKAREDHLRWVGQTAIRRMNVLRAVISYMNGDPTAELQIKEVTRRNTAESVGPSIQG